MRTSRLTSGFARLDAFEGRLCQPCNRITRYWLVRVYFQAVSRLGDGLIWYIILAALPIALGPSALLPTAHLGITALVGVLLYKCIKGSTLRERPFSSHTSLTPMAKPLDRYSFPSGHTLQATAFAIMLAHYYPSLALIMLPFAASVAASRVILGLHYPSDVLVGALLGWALASTSIALYH